MALTPFRRRLLEAWADAARAWERERAGIARATGLRVWNPQLYGLPVYERFARHYLPTGPGALLAFGLNPGKYGMSQTGLPFTDVHTATTQLPRLDFDAPIPGLAPATLRPLLGSFRRERSCQSVYAFLDLAYGSAEAGWRDLWAPVPCGLLFLESDGANVTPADARLARVPAMNALRREIMRDALAVARPRAVIFLGQDVAKVGRNVVEAVIPEARIVHMDHPVARGPGRRGPAWWADKLARELRERRLIPERPSPREHA